MHGEGWVRPGINAAKETRVNTCLAFKIQMERHFHVTILILDVVCPTLAMRNSHLINF